MSESTTRLTEADTEPCPLRRLLDVVGNGNALAKGVSGNARFGLSMSGLSAHRDEDGADDMTVESLGALKDTKKEESDVWRYGAYRL